MRGPTSSSLSSGGPITLERRGEPPDRRKGDQPYTYQLIIQPLRQEQILQAGEETLGQSKRPALGRGEETPADKSTSRGISI